MFRISPHKALTEFHKCIVIVIGADRHRWFQTVHYLYISDLVQYKSITVYHTGEMGSEMCFLWGLIG